MNKQLLSLTLAAVCSSMSIHAADPVEINGINYTILADGTTVMASQSSTAPSGQLVLPSSVTISGKNYTVRAIDGYGFKDCTAITSVSLPNTIDSIGLQAFNGCTAMTSINLQDTKLKALEASTFLYCKSLQSIIIPATVDTVYSNPFVEALALKEIKVAEGNKKYVDIDGVLFNIDKTSLYSFPPGKTTDYVIPEGTVELVSMAFCQARNLRNVKFPKSLKYIRNNAFMRVDSLQKIELPENIEVIAGSAFRECKKAEGEIILPKSLTSLSTYAFYYTSISKLEIPGNIKTIPDAIAQYCVKLKSVKLNEGSTTIGQNAFNTTAIQEIEIPNSVKTIKTAVFEGCTNLKKVTIGESVTSIGIRSFYNLKNITSINVKAATPPTISGTTTYPAFTSTVYSNAVLSVPESAINAYKEAANWKEFAKIEAENSGINNVDNDCISVKVSNSGVIVSAPEASNIDIFSIAGTKIYSGKCGEINLPSKGMYIVRVGIKSFKVIY